MMKHLTMVFAFFIKEVHDIRRQPRLLISLVGGPLLVLGMFGATLRSANPYVTMALVWPEKGISGISQEEAVRAIGSNLSLVKVTSDESEAMRMLEAGEVEVVQVVPEQASDAGLFDANIRLVSKSVDPNAEAWIRSVAFAEVSYINQQLLTRATKQAQDKGRQVVVSLGDARVRLAQLGKQIEPQAIDGAVAYVNEVREALGQLSAALPAVSREQPLLAPKIEGIRVQVTEVQHDLENLSVAIEQSDVAGQIERLDSVLTGMDELRLTINVFVDTPAESIVTPVRSTYTNLRGSAFSLVVFYAPSVLALLVQQLAITLAGLGLVRERQMGAFEMFRVSPLRLSQILVGKSLAHIFFATLAGLVLTVLLTLLRVPLPADALQYVAVLVMLATAAVGVGTLVSALSRTDTQAIQLTMLLLLLSVFFTGFFLPLTGFAWPAWVISFLLPMTHAVSGFKALMLSGASAPAGTLAFLAVITVLSYGAVLLIMRRQYRKVLD